MFSPKWDKADSEKKHNICFAKFSRHKYISSTAVVVNT